MILDVYVKNLEDENEKLRRHIHAALINQTVESNRNFFIYTEDALKADGTVVSLEMTASKLYLRTWMSRLYDHRSLKLGNTICLTCWAHSQRHVASDVSIIVWDVEFERIRPAPKSRSVPKFKMKSGRRYLGRGEYVALKETSIRGFDVLFI